MSTVDNLMATYGSSYANTSTKGTGSNSLSVDDFYQLMAAQLQNQDITNPTSQSDFLNQMALMTVIQAVSDFSAVTTTTYAASLVGQEVTVAEVSSSGKVTEVFGKVTATGLYSGEQIIFVDGVSYKLSQIMAVGKLPETEVKPETEDAVG